MELADVRLHGLDGGLLAVIVAWAEEAEGGYDGLPVGIPELPGRDQPGPNRLERPRRKQPVRRMLAPSCNGSWAS